MGSRGPTPKRKEELNGHRSKEELNNSVTVVPGAAEVRVPRADPEWHPIAKKLWKAAQESGQSRFYEPSDWAVLYSLMDDLSYYKSGAKRSGQMLQTIMSSLSSLLLTEGDRRRLQIELARPTSGELEDAGVVEMNRWRERLTS